MKIFNKIKEVIFEGAAAYEKGGVMGNIDFNDGGNYHTTLGGDQLRLLEREACQ